MAAARNDPDEQSFRGVLSVVQAALGRVVARRVEASQLHALEQVRGLLETARPDRLPTAEESDRLWRTLHMLEPATSNLLAAVLSANARLAIVVEQQHRPDGAGVLSGDSGDPGDDTDDEAQGGRLASALSIAIQRLGTDLIASRVRSGGGLLVMVGGQPVALSGERVATALDRIAQLLPAPGSARGPVWPDAAQLDRAVELLWRAEEKVRPPTRKDEAESVARRVEELVAGPVADLALELGAGLARSRSELAVMQGLVRFGVWDTTAGSGGERGSAWRRLLELHRARAVGLLLSMAQATFSELDALADEERPGEAGTEAADRLRSSFSAVRERIAGVLDAGQDGGAPPTSPRYGTTAELLADLEELRSRLAAHGTAGGLLRSVDRLAGVAGAAGFHLARLEVRGGGGGESLHPALSDEPSLLGAYSGDAIGPYVVPAGGGAAAVLRAVEAAADAGIQGVSLSVAPRVATAAELQGVGDLVDSLLSERRYRELVASNGDLQEVVIAHPDITKEAGFVTAEWDLFRAAVDLRSTATRHGVEVRTLLWRATPFADGGAQSPPVTLPRALVALTSSPTVDSESYLHPRIASRQLRDALVSRLEGLGGREDRGDEARVPERWRETMESLSSTAVGSYRALLGHPGMPRYFRQSTPLGELGWPAPAPAGTRTDDFAGSSVADVEPLAWHLGWVLTRQPIVGFYGLGSALRKARREGLGGLLAEMQAGWPFFRSLLVRAESTLAASSIPVASHYVERLVEPFIASLFDLVVDEALLTEAEVLSLLGHSALLGDSVLERRRVAIRDRCLEPLHRLQVALLARIRGDAPPDPLLREALLRTAGVIAAAL